MSRKDTDLTSYLDGRAGRRRRGWWDFRTDGELAEYLTGSDHEPIGLGRVARVLLDAGVLDDACMRARKDRDMFNRGTELLERSA